MEHGVRLTKDDRVYECEVEGNVQHFDQETSPMPRLICKKRWNQMMSGDR